MAENSDGSEKTEQATPKRVEKARGEGNVSLSVDFSTAILLLTGFVLLALMGPWFMRASAETIRWSLQDALLIQLDDRETLRTFIMHHLPLGRWAMVFCGITFVFGLLVAIGQVGLNFSFTPLMPKLSKINPITGLGRLFGTRGIMRLVFGIFKLIVLGLLAWYLIRHDLTRMLQITPEVGARFAADAHALLWIAIKLISVLITAGAADFIYQRWQHTQDLMMTKQEVKEEYKQSEGDPLIKGRIRQIQRQMAQRRMMQEVPKADVVITNPTHVAVAIKYDQAKMAAPIVLAKGYDAMAQRIKDLAAKHHITLVENVALARALAKDVPIGKPIPVKWYQAVAEVLAMVYKLKKAKAA